jgi:APA family basic amino acid/polyamine antiporter
MKVNLKRDVGFFAATVYGIGVILGAGIYALVGEAVGLAGNAVWLSFVLAAVVSAFTGLSYMELISMFPQSAAEYIYVKNAFNNKLLAFNVGWIEIFADVIANSTVALGFAGYFNALFGTPVVLTAIALIFIMSLINFWGVKESARINTVFSLIEIAGLVFVVLLALFFGHYGSVNYLEMPHGLTGTLGAAALIFFAYIGFEDLANISEEVKDPKRNVPKALLVSVIVTTVIYVLVGMAVVSLVDWQSLAASQAPLAFAVSSVLGNQAFRLMSVIALFATANTVLVGLIVGSREIYGMSRDGTLPKIFSRIHIRRRTPWIAVFATMIFSMAFVLFGNINIVAGITDLGTFYVFIFVNASAIALRYRMPDVKRVFRTPLNIGRFPLISFLGLLSSLILVSYLRINAILIGLGIALVGVVAYFILKQTPVDADA